jgi:hypothetical protein
MAMHYASIDEELLRAFPELSPASQALNAEWRGEKPGQYILFEDVFARYIERLLAASASQARDAKLHSIFQFVEHMFSSGGEVENLAFVGLLEGRSAAWLQAAKPHLGPRAEAALDAYDADWRIRSSTAGSALAVESHDSYGVATIAARTLSVVA